MAKKKQFAGKKTKLAKLVLTEVLSRQIAEEENRSLPPSEPEASSRQFPLPWDGQEETGALSTFYTQITWELMKLHAELVGGQAAMISSQPTFIHKVAPSEAKLKRVLRQTGKDLADLVRRLSRPRQSTGGGDLEIS